MKFLKNKNVLVGLVLFAAFLIEAAPVMTTLTIILPVTELVKILVPYAAIFACVLLITKQYYSKSKFLKTLAVVCGFLMIDQCLSKLLPLEAELAYVIVKPFIVVATIWLALKWISGCKIKIEKIFSIISIALILINALCSVWSYYSIIRILNTMPNNIMTHLALLTQSLSVENISITLCFYLLVFFTAIHFEKFVPILEKPKIVEIKEDNTEKAAPENTWRCMGCGEFVPQEKDRCDCGYRR